MTPKAYKTRNILKNSYLQNDTKKEQQNIEKVTKKIPILEPKDSVCFSLDWLFLQLCFLLGPGVEKIQKMIPPSLQFDPKRQQYNTGPNDTLKTYMPIFRKNRNSFRS
jgi:hypothetical protein